MTRSLPASSLLPCLLLCGACGGATRSTRPAEAHHATETSILKVEAPGEDAARYDSGSEGEGVVTENVEIGGAGKVARLLGERLEPRAPLEGDDRLARLARWSMPYVPQGERLAPRPVVEFLARHLGLTDFPVAMGVTAMLPASDPAPALQDLAALLARRVPDATHFGLFVTERSGLRLLAMALGRRAVRLHPFPRRLEAGTALRLRGSLDVRYAAPHLRAERLTPEGGPRPGETGWLKGTVHVTSTATSPRRRPRIEGRILLKDRGVYRLLLTGEGPNGEEPLLSLPLYVGEPPPQTLRLSLAPRDAIDPDAARADLAKGITQLRERHDLSPLVEDPLLDEVADAHARELVARGVLSHRSTSGADPAERLRVAEYPHRLVLENLGRADDVTALLRAWMHSESHRRNLLHPDARRVGLAVRPMPPGEGGGLLVVALFVQPPELIDTETAPDELLAAINRIRRTRRARPLRRDDELLAAARAAARRYFDQPELDEQQVVEEATASLRRLSIAYGRIGGVLVTVGKLQEAARIEPVLDPSVRYVGLGVAQGSRPGSPPNQIVVVVLLGWPR